MNLTTIPPRGSPLLEELSSFYLHEHVNVKRNK